MEGLAQESVTDVLFTPCTFSFTVGSGPSMAEDSVEKV